MDCASTAENLDVEYLDKFFAVTKTAIYEVVAKGNNNYKWPSATRIAELEKNEEFPIGASISDQMLSVGKWLQFYVPEKYSMVSPLVGEERRLEMVNTMYWSYRTSYVVALFKDKEDALKCHRSRPLSTPDERWIKSTQDVIELIGEEHPNFSVTHYHDLALSFS